ncbi:MAG: hypothetical protein L6R39_001119, partial [Caloplaca ligustica]
MSRSVVESNTGASYLVGVEASETLPQIWTSLTNHAHDNGDHPAIKSFHQQDSTTLGEDPDTDGEVIWTYAELHAKAESLAARLYLSGVRKSHTIVAFLDNRAEWALMLWVSIRLNAIFVPVNPRITQSITELSHVLRVTKPKVLVVLDKDDARRLERAAADSAVADPIQVVLSRRINDLTTTWNFLGTLMDHTSSTAPDQGPDHHTHNEFSTVPPSSNDLDQDMCVIFTSGTTSLPKASVSSYRNLLAAAIACKSFRHLNDTSVLLQHIPVFHSWSIGTSLAFWISGATVVYPSKSFDPRATLSAIEHTYASHMLAVPSMIQAIIAHPSLGAAKLGSLQVIDLSGTIILPEVIKACMDTLRVPHVSVQYGMTEGSYILGFDIKAIPYESHSIPTIVPCGTVMPEARLRVCVPGSRKVLERGKAGELHIGGSQVTRGYLDRESNEFYIEGGIYWLVTGDQATIDKDGLVYILGRYKDLIIRGGENIPPAAIERCLDSIAGIKDSQVVGIPDEVAGEVPVAVLRKCSGFRLSNYEIQQVVIKDLGKIFSPQAIFDLVNDLHLDDYPRTLSGKIKKRELRTIIEPYMSIQKQNTDGQPNKSTLETLMQFWAQITGRRAEDISPDECAETFADSIVMMQFCNLVSRNMHKTIAVEDLVGNINISRQAEIIGERPVKEQAVRQHKRRDPPNTEDIALLFAGDRPKAQIEKDKISNMLAPFKLGWDDVEDVFPTSEQIALMSRPFHLRSWNRQHAYHAPNVNTDVLRWAVKSCLEVHPLFRSLIVDAGKELPLYVVCRPTDCWFSLAISEGYTVDKAEDLRSFHLDDDVVDFAIPPGPLFKALIVRIRDSDSSGVIYFGHHSNFDALSHSLFNEDLDTALRTLTPPRAHADFKPFAEKKYLYRNSPNASTALAYHVSRLKGWSKHRSALWPPQRAPQFFRGKTTYWKHLDGTPGSPHERRTLDTNPQGVAGITQTFTLPQLPTIKSTHGITPPTIFVAALALLNTHRTSCSQAFFAQVFASRVWPTEQGDPDPSLPNMMDIPGPTFERVINRITITPSEPLLSFLLDLETEQKLLAHHAPFTYFKQLERALRSAGDATLTENELYDSVFRRQCFNWLPSSKGVKWECMKEMQSMSRADIGLQWNFVHLSETEVK